MGKQKIAYYASISGEFWCTGGNQMLYRALYVLCVCVVYIVFHPYVQALVLNHIVAKYKEHRDHRDNSLIRGVILNSYA